MTKRNPCGMKKIKTIFGSKVEMPNLFQHLKLSLRTVLMTVPNYLKTRTVPVFLKASLRALAKVVIARAKPVAILLFLITSVPIILNAQPSAMVITTSSTLTTCFERDINQGTTWFQTETAFPDAMAATMQHIQVKHSPTTEERILGMLNNAGAIYVSTWTTTNGWGNFASNPVENAIIAANDDFRGFDLAYEQSSGEGIVVFQDNTSS